LAESVALPGADPVVRVVVRRHGVPNTASPLAAPVIACIRPETAFTVVMLLALAILVLQQAGWGACRKCRKAHREPRCGYCDQGSISNGGDGDIRKPRFKDQISRRKRGED
jgi:hypothetical protein